MTPNAPRLSALGAALALLATCTSARQATTPTPVPASVGSTPVAAATSTTSAPPATTNANSTVPVDPAVETVRVRGTARLDGSPLSAQFLGAVVRSDGLVTPCQAEIPAVTQGEFEITVFGDRRDAGCGHLGAEIILWTYVGEQRIFAETPVNWPTSRTADAEVTFSTADPAGAVPTTLTEFFGQVRDHNGQPLPTGSRVEAYVGSELCGVASTRSGDFDGYLIDIVGPDARPGCSADAEVTFRVDGRAAIETTRNDGRGQRDPFDLTV